MLDNEKVCEELLREFKWLQDDESEDYLITLSGDRVVDTYDLDVNFSNWHNGVFTGHPIFKFEEKSPVIKQVIKLTESNYEEFKRLLRCYEAEHKEGQKC